MGNIPLLPVLVKKVTKTVKRAWEKVSEATVTLLLDLPEFEVTHFETEGEVLHLKCAHKEELAMCPRCQEFSTEVHETKASEVRDLSVWGKRVKLHFDRRRFKCVCCGAPFTERLPSIDPRQRHTRRYQQFIYEQCKISDRKAIAKREKLSASTVREIFIKLAKLETRRSIQQSVRVLGIDEISLKKRHKQYALVLPDLERHCVIAVLPNRKKETFICWLKTLPETDRKAIRCASTDMWEPYRQAIKAILPQATHVADRFHVIKQLNKRLTQVRRAAQNRADDPTREVLKGSRWILVKARHSLTDDEETKLQAVLDVSPELRTMYLLKEEFRTICDKACDREQACRLLRVWIWKVRSTHDKRLLKFVNTLLNWWDEFLNYFLSRVTQGFVEGINNAIRTIIRRAYGFRNFTNFRLQVLAQHGGI